MWNVGCGVLVGGLLGEVYSADVELMGVVGDCTHNRSVPGEWAAGWGL